MTATLDERLRSLLSEYTVRLRQLLIAEMQGVMTEIVGQPGNGDPAARAMPMTLPDRGVKTLRPCLAVGCRNLSRGPRFKYLCREHDYAKDDDAQLAEWKAANEPLLRTTREDGATVFLKADDAEANAAD